MQGQYTLKNVTGISNTWPYWTVYDFYSVINAMSHGTRVLVHETVLILLNSPEI
jgi:hypothetical protein